MLHLPAVRRVAPVLFVTLLMVGTGVGRASVAGEARAPAELRLDRIDRAAPGDKLPPGWDVRPVRGEEPPTTEVVTDSLLGNVLRFESVDQAAFYGNELAEELDPAGGRLRWSWKVGGTLPNADLRAPDADDSLARVMVVFGTGGLFSRPHILFYTWGNAEQVDTDFPSRVSDKMHIVVLRNAEDPTGRWVTEERDLLADFRAIFGEEPDPVSGIGFMSDTENLPTEGVSFLGPVIWEPAG